MAANRQRVVIKPFKPAEMIYDYSSLLFAGPKKSGKSYGARCVIFDLKNRVYDATVYSGSREEDHPWTEYVPEAFVFKGYNEENLGRVMDRQDERRTIAAKYGVKPPGHMIIFEDLEYKKKNVFDSEAARQVMLNGRHDKTFPICLVQYIMRGLTLEVRSMFDFAFFTKEPNVDVRKKIWKVFGGVCTSFDEFDTIFRMCTENHRMLVIALRNDSYVISDSFFYFKAKDMGPYHIGHPDFWKMAEDIKQSAKKSTPKPKTEEDETVQQQPAKRKRLTKQDTRGKAVYKDSDSEINPLQNTMSAYSVKTGKIFEIMPNEDI